MATIIGCTNTECKAYKKVHYKKDAKYCMECGEPLSPVCAECWKTLDEDTGRLCISCKAKHEQQRAQVFDKAKDVGGKAVAGLAAVAAVVGGVAKDADKIAVGVKKIANIAVKIVK